MTTPISRLLPQISAAFNLDGIHNICDALTIDYDNLAGGTKDRKIGSLLHYICQHGREDELLAYLRERRNTADWPESVACPDSAAPPQRLPAALRPYLELIARRSDALPLGPVDPTGRESAHVALGQVFVNLNAGDAEYAVRPGAPPLSERYRAALAHIHRNRQLILLGDPGSGKSTLLRYLAYCLAQAWLHPQAEWLSHLKWTHELVEKREGDGSSPDHLSSLSSGRSPDRAGNSLPALSSGQSPDRAGNPAETVEKQWTDPAPIPIFIELRDFANTNFDPGDPLGLLKFALRQLTAQGLQDAQKPLAKAAASGQAIFLLDGVDEVPLKKRPRVWEAVAALERGVCGGSRWAATCRVLSFDPKEAPNGIPVQTLRPLTETQIKQFVTSWYKALQEELGRVKADDFTQKLHAAVERPRIRALAENPMMLTIMAIVQTYHGTLPDERAKLYQACVETLLLRWQRHKNMPDPLTQLATTQEELERLLWEIAWQAHSQVPEREEAADIPENDVIAIAKEALGGWGKAEQFIEYTERRAHLLVGKGGKKRRVYAFPHRTFQEYLAACRLASRRRFPQETAALAVQGDTWREVLNLAAGALVFNQNNREKALDGAEKVLPAVTPTHDDEAGWNRVWRAAEILLVVGKEAAEKDEVGRELLPRARAQLLALTTSSPLPPRQRAEAGTVMGRLGDPRPDVNCKIPSMITIPATPFLMGSDKAKDGMADNDETPQHTVDLPAYRIGKYPVTVAQYRYFVDSGGYNSPDYWTEKGWQYRQEDAWTAPRFWDDPRWTAPNLPVIGVSWFEAIAYCNWLQAETGRFFHLPSEAMWEKAARGTEGQIYPWGDEWDPQKLNAYETGIGQTSPVGMFPEGKSPYGLYDASGNMLEWCSTKWGSYPFNPQNYEKEIRDCDSRSWRGGAFDYSFQGSRAAYRSNFNPGYRLNNLGLRVAEHLSDPAF